MVVSIFSVQSVTEAPTYLFVAASRIGRLCRRSQDVRSSGIESDLRYSRNSWGDAIGSGNKGVSELEGGEIAVSPLVSARPDSGASEAAISPDDKWMTN